MPKNDPSSEDQDNEMDDLKARNRKIIFMRTEKLMTLKAIGDVFGISRERVRQIVGNNKDIYKKRRKKKFDLIKKIVLRYSPEIPGTEISEKENIPVYLIHKARKELGITRETMQKKLFFSRVSYESNNNECWPWEGYVHPQGHGIIPLGESAGERIACRLAWKYKYGEIPKGHWVRHKCGNKLCVNPNHLYLHKVKKLTADQVARARLMKINYPDMPVPEIKEKLGIKATPDAIRVALRGLNWKKVPMDKEGLEEFLDV